MSQLPRLFVAIFLCASEVSAFDVFPVATRDGLQYEPDVQSSLAVWCEHNATNPEIEGVYVKDVIAGQERWLHEGRVYSPRMADDRIVWVQGDNSDWNIWGYDLRTDTASPVTTSPSGQYYPVISGDYVIWEDDRESLGYPIPDDRDIYGKNLLTGEEFCVYDGMWEQIRPAIDGDIVVWEDHRNESPYGWPEADIYGCDLRTMQVFPIAVDIEALAIRPDISGDIIVWEDSRPVAEGEDPWPNIYGYDMSTGEEFVICDAPGSQANPKISGNIVVWTDNRDGVSMNIYGYDLSTGEEFVIFSGSGQQYFAQVDGNLVVWFDEDGRDIYGAYIPEPLSALMLVAGGIGLLSRRRRSA